MTVTAIGNYVGTPRDIEANFNGGRLLYICWDKHLMFAAPFAFLVQPSMLFREVLEKMLAHAIRQHPEAHLIDWEKCVWEKSDKSWTPDYNRSIEENGIRHKSFLRFTAPGLDGYKGLGI